MHHFGMADAEGERAECTVGGGVRIPANQRQPGLGNSLFRPDDMRDALTLIAKFKDCDPCLAGIFMHIANPGEILDILGFVPEARNEMIGRTEGTVGAAEFQPPLPQTGKAGSGAVMHEMAVNIEKGEAVIALKDEMFLPDFIE